MLRPAYLSQKLDRPLPTKDGGTLRTIREACDYMTSIGNQRERRQHGFLYSNGNYTTLNDPFATTNTTAFGINDAGQIVGFYSNAGNNHGFLYDPNSGVSP